MTDVNQEVIIPEVVYRGQLEFLRFVTNGKKDYLFTPENGYIIRPESFGDLYEMLAFEDAGKSIVLADDPMSKTNYRRVVQIGQWEKDFSPELAAAMEQAKIDADKQIRIRILKQDFINDIMNKVAVGAVTKYPEQEELMKLAEEYAQEQLAKLYQVKVDTTPATPVTEPVVTTPEDLESQESEPTTNPVDNSVSPDEPSTTETISQEVPVTPEEVATVTEPEVTQPTEPVVETPVETTTMETPVEPTAEETPVAPVDEGLNIQF
jgi:hypothetical protein